MTLIIPKEQDTDIQIHLWKLINFIDNEVRYNKADKQVAIATVIFLEKFLESQKDLEEKNIL